MKTSIIGYPRVGSQRELKFTCEKYFRKEIDAEKLFETAKSLRTEHWNIQRENGIDFIPSNDFSFYDNMLDTAYLFNIIPERYKALNLSGIDNPLLRNAAPHRNGGTVTSPCKCRARKMERKDIMERITERDEFGNTDIIGVDSAELQLNLDLKNMNRVTYALNLLAEYEETGYTPNDIKAVMSLADKMNVHDLVNENLRLHGKIKFLELDKK